MSAKQLLRLALIFGVLLLIWGGAALARRHEATSDSGDALKLPAVSRSAVERVMLTKPGDTVVLARRDTSTWTVNGYPAAPQAIKELFDALGDSTPSSELVAEQKSSHPGLEVDSAKGTRVKIEAKGRTLIDLVVGRRSPDFSGGYMRRADQDATYLVQGRLMDLLSRNADDWRDKRIATVPADSIGSIEVSHRSKQYVLRRDGKEWKLSTGTPVDSARARELAAAYQTVEAAAFASPAQADSARFGSPDRRVRLLRKDRTPLVTLLFDSTASGFWVKSDTGKTIYRLDSWNVDRFAPPDTSLRAHSSPAKPKK